MREQERFFVIKAVIFDFDMTLVDYMKSDYHAMCAVASIGPKKIDATEFWNKSGDILEHIYNENITGSAIHSERLIRTLAFYGIEWNDTYLTTYLHHYLNSVYVFTGVREVLEILKEKVKLGLLTNACDPAEQRIRIANTGLSDLFDTICISGETQKYKPHKNAFDDILKKLCVAPHETVYIGDSETNDIIGAKNAGLYAIKKGKSTQPTKADAIFDDYNKFFDVLQNLILV